MVTEIKNFIKYKDFLAAVVKRDIKKKYYKSYLGVFWTVLRPLFMTLVISIVFSTLFKRALPNYPLYYLTGNLLFHFNSDSTSVALNSIMKNSGIIRKIYIPKYMFVISDLTVSLINLLFSFIPMIGVVLFTGVKITWLWLFIPFVLILQFIFTLGLCLILAAYGVFFRDLPHLYGILVMVWMYFTPLFYPISIIPEKFLFIWELNPMVNYIGIFRDIVYYVTIPSMQNIIVAFVYGVLTLTLGCVIFNESQEKFFLYL